MGLHYFVWLGVVIAWPKSGAAVLYTHIYAGDVTKRYLQWGIISSCLVIVFSAALWLPYVVAIFPLGGCLRQTWGLGALLSLRNENIENIWGIISPQLSVFDVMFGGAIRFPTRIEMMPLIYLSFWSFGAITICFTGF